MIEGRLTTLTGREVSISIPESLSEIPLARFLPADIEYQRIVRDYGEILFSNDYRFLSSVVKFLGFILKVPANELLGCKTGNVDSNAKKIYTGLEEAKLSDSLDASIYALFSHISGLFNEVTPIGSDISEVVVNGKIFDIPEYLKKGLDVFNANDLLTWQGIECAEVQRLLVAQMDKLRGQDDEFDVLALGEDDLTNYIQLQFNSYLRIMAALLRPTDAIDGQFDIDLHIENVAKELQDIDTKTALDIFFSGFQLGDYYLQTISSTISSIAQALQE